MNWLTKLFRRTSPRPDAEIGRLERHIGYRFRDPNLLQRSLTHRSYIGQQDGQRRDSNERLEFLGDAVLELCVSQYLYKRFPRKKEGELTKFKSIIVSGNFLVNQARQMGLGRYLLLSDSEERTGGRDRPSILEDAFESLIGAIYLDGGLAASERFVDSHVLNDLDLHQATRENRNYKSLLLELSQSQGLGIPVYRVVEELGPDHSKFFVIDVQLGNAVLGRGTGPSKKKAEQAAAAEALHELRVHEIAREEGARESPSPPDDETASAEEGTR